jgi:class 3 adenylate cyclase
MPLFMDRHDVPGATAEDLAVAHAADVGVEHKHGVRYLTYWFDPDAGSVFCLAEGPDRDAVEDVHREAHGLLASTIVEVEPGTVQSFFGPVPSRPVGEAYVDSAVRAVLFTDICDSTALTHTLGDEGVTALVREHDRIVRAALVSRDGREVKHTGDGIMASFSSVSAAVEAAIDVQRTLAARNDDGKHPINIRIGISAGEPITDEGDLFGATVQLAARLCAHSKPGGITVSVAVRELCIGKRLEFVPLGAVTLKGFPEPTHCYEATWGDA